MSEQKKFLVTRELGRLARWLRILGFDTRYFSSAQKSQLIICSLQENRIIITKSKNIGPRQGIRFISVHSDFVKEQLRQVIHELKLTVDKNDFFRRCILCNIILQPVEKDTVKNDVPEYVYQTQNEFMRCGRCGRLYWQGTHWGNVEAVLTELLSKKTESSSQLSDTTK